MAASRLDRLRDWVALFLMGTINNLPYVVVNSSAKILASRSAVIWVRCARGLAIAVSLSLQFP
jgi:hypothetical protein